MAPKTNSLPTVTVVAVGPPTGDERWWPATVTVEGFVGWTVNVVIDAEADVVTELRVDAPDGLTSSRLRELPLGTIHREVRPVIARRARSLLHGLRAISAPGGSGPNEGVRTTWAVQTEDGMRAPTEAEAAQLLALWERNARRLDRTAANFSMARRPGRAGRADFDYAEVAALYVELVVEGGEPVSALAERLGVSVAQTRSLLHTARSRKLLTPSPAGRVGGRLTPKAIELLSGEDV